jgi:hypothetical protein
MLAEGVVRRGQRTASVLGKSRGRLLIPGSSSDVDIRAAVAGQDGGPVVRHDRSHGSIDPPAAVLVLLGAAAVVLGAYLAGRPIPPRVSVFFPPLGGRCASPRGCPATSSLLPSQRRCGHKAASLLIPEGASVNAVRKQLGTPPPASPWIPTATYFPTSWTRLPGACRPPRPGADGVAGRQGVAHGGPPSSRSANAQVSSAEGSCRRASNRRQAATPSKVGAVNARDLRLLHTGHGRWCPSRTCRFPLPRGPSAEQGLQAWKAREYRAFRPGPVGSSVLEPPSAPGRGRRRSTALSTNSDG